MIVLWSGTQRKESFNDKRNVRVSTYPALLQGRSNVIVAPPATTDPHNYYYDGPEASFYMEYDLVQPNSMHNPDYNTFAEKKYTPAGKCGNKERVGASQVTWNVNIDVRL